MSRLIQSFFLPVQPEEFTNHDGTASTMRKFTKPTITSRLTALLLPILAITGLYIFSSSFFLAKRSLPRTSTCKDVRSLLLDTLHLPEALVTEHALIPPESEEDCWMPKSVDKLVIIVVDALRFDFAQHSLPRSFGKRLAHPNNKLLQFLADPPTVTMQRLKALTTGGLPTFAEISGNMGGAYVEEDSWVDFLANRGKKLGFVGDDTWVDLFPTQWKEAHPFASFNTRDLDTVDNGCLEFLPPLLDDLEKGELDVVVSHFLGVDHVGHTYGPHSEYMDMKLSQMDEILDATLTQLEVSPKQCILTYIFGDHGMTEDGNHGGGTPEEIQAALFVHTSFGCAPFPSNTAQELNQIDLVPTLSLLLGLPIPYANLGGLVPSLIPGQTDKDTALALALNAAQIWRYLSEYSRLANRLPLQEIEGLLDAALVSYKDALSSDTTTGDYYIDASVKLKAFLDKATELGKRVWTRFDGTGMLMGGVLVGIVLIVSFYTTFSHVRIERVPKLEDALTIVFVIATCGVLTFGNSYIEHEQSIVAFSMSVICVAISARLYTQKAQLAWVPLLLPVCARLNELLVHGHGLDPAIPLYMVHTTLVFLSSLALLAVLRTQLLQPSNDHTNNKKADEYVDLATLFLAAIAWWEKRQPDTSRNGYLPCRVALSLWALGFLHALYQVVVRRRSKCLLAIKVGIAIMLVTGPSTATSMVLFCTQVWALETMAQLKQIADPVHSFLWRLTIRHVFFATNHACAFNRLQYSAAFIATQEFIFATGGISLFTNTFGYEILGMLLIPGTEWKYYSFYQLMETTISFISVSLMRRHLMVWAVFAPRFIFAAIFLVLSCLGQVVKELSIR